MWVGEVDAEARPGVAGYVLAGGRSSRMGRDKALLELGGRPLIEHAVRKLKRVCMEVRILAGGEGGDSARAERLAAYGPVVFDLHPGCGPIGGIEAALAHSTFDWNLFLPVDMPFLPTAFLDSWVHDTVRGERLGLRLAFFTVARVSHPALLMVHRDADPYIGEAVARGEYKLLPVLEGAGRGLAEQRGLVPERVLHNARCAERGRFTAKGEAHSRPWQTITEAQQASRRLWFANLNSPEEFAEAEAHANALDT
jgi:molybdopterin-guanine dinucleotide biosynthesis protein A